MPSCTWSCLTPSAYISACNGILSALHCVHHLADDEDHCHHDCGDDDRADAESIDNDGEAIMARL